MIIQIMPTLLLETVNIINLWNDNEHADPYNESISPDLHFICWCC